MLVNALVIGLGIAGQRHVSILKKLGFEVETVSRHSENGSANFRELSSSIDLRKVNYVVIANETYLHEKTYGCLEDLGYFGPVLIEKPLNFNHNDFDHKNAKNIFVGFNLRFHPAIISLREKISALDSEIIHVDLQYGNSTDNWRRSNDIRRSYSASITTGGGVLRDFSHEIDLVHWLFGKVKLMSAHGAKLGNFMEDGHDYVSFVLKGEAGTLINVNLNTLQSEPSRTIRIFSTLGAIEVDLIKNTINGLGRNELFDLRQDHTYLEMHMNIISNKDLTAATLSDGLYVDELIQDIENFIEESRFA